MENENQNQYLIRLVVISTVSVLFLYIWNTFIFPPNIPAISQSNANYQNQNDSQNKYGNSQKSSTDITVANTNFKNEIIDHSFKQQNQKKNFIL